MQIKIEIDDGDIASTMKNIFASLTEEAKKFMPQPPPPMAMPRITAMRPKKIFIRVVPFPKAGESVTIELAKDEWIRTTTDDAVILEKVVEHEEVE